MRTSSGGPIRITATRLSMLSAPKHRKKYKGGASFGGAISEIAKARSQNLLEKAAPTPNISMAISSSDGKIGPNSGGEGSGNDFGTGGHVSDGRGGGAMAGSDSHEMKSSTTSQHSGEVASSAKKSGLNGKSPKPMSLNPRPSPLSASTKKLWKMPEHFVKLLKPEENNDGVATNSPAKQSFADNMKKNVTRQSRLYGPVGGRGRPNNKIVSGSALPSNDNSKTPAALSNSNNVSTSAHESPTNTPTIPTSAATNPGPAPSNSQSTEKSIQPTQLSTQQQVTLHGTNNRTQSSQHSREVGKTVTVTAPALSIRYDRKFLRGGGTDSSSSAANTSPTPSSRMTGAQQSHMVIRPRPGTSSPTRSGTAGTTNGRQAAPSQDTDNIFSRFQSTGKTRSFGISTASSQKVSSRKKTEMTNINATRTKLGVTRSAPSAGGGNGRSTMTMESNQSRGKVLSHKLNSGGSSKVQNHGADEDNSLASTDGSSNAEMPQSQAARGSSIVQAAIVSNKHRPSNGIARARSSTTSSPSRSGKHIGGKVNIRDVLRGNHSSAAAASTRQDPVRVRNQAVNDNGKSKNSGYNVSPRQQSNTERSGITSSDSGNTTATSHRDNTKDTATPSISSSLQPDVTNEVVISQELHKPTSSTKVFVSTVIDSGEKDEDIGAEGNSNQHFNSLASSSTSPPPSSTENSPRNSKSTMNVLQRGAFERKSTATVSRVTYPDVTVSQKVDTIDTNPTVIATPVVDKEEEVVDEAASAAAIELRNARRRFRLSRDAAAAAADSRKTAGGRREFSFVAASNRRSATTALANASTADTTSGGKVDSPLSSPGKRDASRKTINSPTRPPHKNVDGIVKNSPTSSPTPTVALTTTSPSYHMPIRMDKITKSCFRKLSAAGTPSDPKRVRFQDDPSAKREDEKFKYAHIMKPKVVIRSKPPLAPARFDSPPPRNVEEALLYSKLKAESLRNNEDSLTKLNTSANRMGNTTPPLNDSARSDVTMSLDRDDREDYHLTFEKEEFIF